MLSNIRVILVGTSHPGNIGSCDVDGQSIALAAGASDILKHLVKVDSLEEAIADCSLVIATSARSRTLDWPMLDPREAGQKLVTEGLAGPVAIVFGRENHGLTNEELQQCTYHVAIPANPEYSSLNLAQAVQIICYETRVAHLAQMEAPQAVEEYPLSTDLERFFVHLESTLSSTGFIIKNHPGQVMTKLRRMFSRARIESQEMNILRGILTSIDKVVSNKQK